MSGRPALLLAALAVVAAACAGSAPGDDRAASPPAPVADTPVGTAAPTDGATAGSPAAASVKALDFVAPSLDGGEVRGADFAGRDVVLWMWAPW